MEKYYFPQGALNKPAKLYKRFVYEGNATVSNTDVDANTEITEQANNIVANGEFRYIFERKTEKGIYEIMNGLIQGEETIGLRTNSLKKFEEGDYIWLKNIMFSEGAWFVIKPPIIIDFIYCPKMRQTYQHLTCSRVKQNPNIINN